jgi:hypothetical protein
MSNGNTCSSIQIYATGSNVVSERYDSIDCLLNGLQDNTNNLITAKNVRDAVFTLWNRVDDIQGDLTDIYFSNSETVPVTVGGIQAGLSFSEPKSMQQMWDLLLYPELNPSLINPFSTFTSNVTGFREIGSIVDITFNSAFNRGSINPQYQSDEPFRSGLPVSYQFNGSGISGTYNSILLTDTRIVSGYEVLNGIQTWQGRVNYDEGVQPKTNKGNDFDIPLPTGFTSFISRTITGVYPFFATSADITVLLKQPLVAHNSQFFQFDLQADSGVNKQTFEIPTVFSNITGIQQFNNISNQWDWLGGDESTSLDILNTQFTKTNINKTINSYQILYSRYVYNGPIIGFRQIRLYTN